MFIAFIRLLKREMFYVDNRLQNVLPIDTKFVKTVVLSIVLKRDKSTLKVLMATANFSIDTPTLTENL